MVVAKLGPAGEYARRQMSAALADVGMTAPPGSIARYAHAADRLAALRKAWEADGCPATAPGSRGQVIAHPLLAELRATELVVTQLAESCGVKAMPARSGWPAGRPRAPDRRPRGELVALTDRLRADDAG